MPCLKYSFHYSPIESSVQEDLSKLVRPNIGPNMEEKWDSHINGCRQITHTNNFNTESITLLMV